MQNSLRSPISPKQFDWSQHSKSSSRSLQKSHIPVPVAVQQKKGYQLKDPSTIDDFLKSRQQTMTIKREAEKPFNRNTEIYKPHDLLSRVFPESTNHIDLHTLDNIRVFKSQISDNIDQKQNFFEFNSYFYKNYQANNHGPCTVLPQRVIKRVEQFQDKLQKMIDEI